MEASDWLVFLQPDNELLKPPAHWIQSAFPRRAKPQSFIHSIQLIFTATKKQQPKAKK